MKASKPKIHPRTKARTIKDKIKDSKNKDKLLAITIKRTWISGISKRITNRTRTLKNQRTILNLISVGSTKIRTYRNNKTTNQTIKKNMKIGMIEGTMKTGIEGKLCKIEMLRAELLG